VSTASAIPATIDALYTLFTAALGGVAVVYDGAAMTDAADTARLYVGMTEPDHDDFDTAAESEQDWAWLGHTQRDETLHIRCAAWSWDANGVMKTARDTAFLVVKAATDALQNDPKFGAVVLYSLGVTTQTLYQLQDDDGAKVRLPFTITCRARLS
jgi:hypothetical protein